MNTTYIENNSIDRCTETTPQIFWRCPACGDHRATLQMPEENKLQTIKRMIEDHIELGCAAYPSRT